ncbi:hypothetical protein PV721_40705 [Streptomyces sp. MB09-01]|uniref:hypothetical protein n=1 Tax=Streptomyces sp. MB09-01 TaxID=3028666 RepID=UPI0029BA5060|nr:hypothetical protein [Streptomyces sp. MB09-01]MDX3540512.1 hypothetical protein [Streptomyces sp. MB09-01]
MGLGVALLGTHGRAPARAAESICGAKEYAGSLPAAQAAEATGLLERSRDAFDSALATAH